MKKRIWIPIALSVLLLALLFVPIPTGQMKDGGTRVYSALTYKIVKYNRLYEDGLFTSDRVYFGANAWKSVDELFAIEEENIEKVLFGTFVRFEDSFAIINALSSEWEYANTALGYIKFDISDLSVIGVNSGSTVKVTYKGGIMESYPAVINAVDWSLAKLTRYDKYDGKWLDEATAQASDVQFTDLRITEIYSDCFFAESLNGGLGIIKLNGLLSDEWCARDVVICTYENARKDANGRIECDYLTIEKSDFLDENTLCAKPVIYLYPEDVTPVSVKLDYKGVLTCTYPKYTDGWNITAHPDGTLTDENGKEYNYLYWEGITDTEYDFSEGFCIRGEDTAEFLESALEKLGLTRREANEFIVYWLHLMQENEYNVISFQEDAYTDIAGLDISPAPDTLIRVFMAWQASDVYVDIPEQKLTSPVREGFTAVEWGGTQLKK